MIIELQPTGRLETFRGMQYRIFVGVTDRGIRLEMLGMFRIPDPNENARFVSELGAIPLDQPAHLLTDAGLIKS